jgi:hypothetical protein
VTLADDFVEIVPNRANGGPGFGATIDLAGTFRPVTSTPIPLPPAAGTAGISLVGLAITWKRLGASTRGVTKKR